MVQSGLIQYGDAAKLLFLPDIRWMSKDRKREHEVLFLKLRILFAGWKPVNNDYKTSQEYFIKSVLFKAYKFVIDLRTMRNNYESLSQQEIQYQPIANLIKEVEAWKAPNPDSKRAVLVDLRALEGQVRIFSPYDFKIRKDEEGIFSNLGDFLDVSEEVKRSHLKKINDLLPQVFQNIVTKNRMKEQLDKDYLETKEISEEVGRTTRKKMRAVEESYQFYDNYFSTLEQELESIAI